MVGNATVFSESTIDEELLDRARVFVIKGMDDGVFDDIYDGVVGVHYRSMEIEGASPPPTTPTTTRPPPPPPPPPSTTKPPPQVARSISDESTNSAKIWGPIVGVAAVIAVIAAAVLVRRQHKRQQRQGSTVPIGIRPSTQEDYVEREFNIQTRSSWDVLQKSPSAQREELGISARGLADSPRELDPGSRSSWNALQFSSSQQKMLEISTQDSSFIDLRKAQEEKWDDESVLTN